MNKATLRVMELSFIFIYINKNVDLQIMKWKTQLL
jgi:hypothetical protein